MLSLPELTQAPRAHDRTSKHSALRIGIPPSTCFVLPNVQTIKGQGQQLFHWRSLKFGLASAVTQVIKVAQSKYATLNSKREISASRPWTAPSSCANHRKA